MAQGPVWAIETIVGQSGPDVARDQKKSPLGL